MRNLPKIFSQPYLVRSRLCYSCFVCMSVVCDVYVLWLNSALWSKSYYWQPMRSRILGIDWYQNEWPWPLFRGRIKVKSTIALHSTLNISETVRDRGLVPKEEMAYGLSNGHVTDDVTWPQRCCETVRSAILATAWLLVLRSFENVGSELQQWRVDDWTLWSSNYSCTLRSDRIKFQGNARWERNDMWPAAGACAH